jgi:hypothetical protein
MKYKQPDIRENLQNYLEKNSITDRFASFDFCYAYFHPNSKNNLEQNMEKSCLAIGFYLASWGMLRGSSFLLNKSVKYYEPLVEYIKESDPNIWDIDVCNYSNDNINKIVEIYSGIKNLLIPDNKSDLTLVTKVMLGVFGVVPAFDNYFGNTFRGIFSDCRFRRINKKSLSSIKTFYEHNSSEIDRFQIPVKSFSEDKETNLYYPKSKIIDMYGFAKGISK